jgi:hypothetical protein
MAAYRLARRERPSRASAALQLLTSVPPLPASCASPKAPTFGALARLGGSEPVNVTLKEYWLPVFSKIVWIQTMNSNHGSDISG